MIEVIDNALITVCSSELPSFGYLLVEFPTEFFSLPNVTTTVTNTLDQYFVSMLPQDSRIEGVYWDWEEDVLKVWTVIPEPDFALESPLYEAQMRFMEQFREFSCDFSVIYRFGKSQDSVRPQGGRRVK